MGRLIEQSIPALFHGVSRQPAHMRHPGQVDECVNHILSVERGGAEKRFGSDHVLDVSWIDSTHPVQLHAIDRDDVERYLVLIQNGTLKVYTAAGVERAVTVAGSSGAYIAGDAEADLVFVTVADYTFVLNRTKTVAMSAATVPTPKPRAVIYIGGARQGTFGVKIDGTNYTNNPATANPSAGVIAQEIGNSVYAGGTGPFTVVVSNSYLFVERTDGADFAISPIEDYADFVTVWKDSVAVASGLPPRSADGTVFRVGSASSDSGFYVKFVARAAGTYEGVWEEAAKPGVVTSFDATTMPHVLVRNGDGTFTLKAATWAERTVGDDDTAPPPEFVGLTLSDIAFHRGRMALVAGETVYFSRSGDLFNFWPDRTTLVTDADPFGLTASGSQIALMRFAVPFRQTLFLTSTGAQFEITGDVLAAGRASLGTTSAYTASATCRPLPCGDGLFLVAADGAGSALLEYTYDSDSLTNIAADVSRHARGYIPSGVKQLVGDPLSGTLVLRPGGAATSLYVYTYFWQGREQVQSAWHRWILGDAVRSVALIDDGLYAVVMRGIMPVIERVPMRRPDASLYDYLPRLDRQTLVTGTYSALNDRTTWTLPYVAANATAIPSADHRPGVALVPTNHAGTTLTAPGNWTGKPVLIGCPFSSRLELSTLYLRENNLPLVTGRTQVRYVSLSYEDTRTFTSTVTHTSGAEAERTHVVPVLGVFNTLPSPKALGRGVARIRASGRNTETSIALTNDTAFPHLFTGGAWAAFYNEVTRQG